MNPPAHASPLLREAAFLLQTPSLATLQTGWIWKIERNENGADTTARRVFAVIRGLFLILCDGEMDCPIELFSLLEIGIETESVMVEREDKCEDVTRSGPGSAIPDTTTEQLVTVSRRDSTLFSFFPIESSVEQWILALQRASAALRHLRSAGRQAILPCPPGGGGGGPQDSEGRRPDATAISTLSRDTSRAQGPAADRAAALLVYETRREVEQLTEQNSRLQLSADAVTRAAGEMVEQKVTEVQLLKAQVGRLQKDKRHLREEISKLRQELSRCSTDALNNRKAAAEAREHLRRMKDDMEAAARAPGQQRLALQITRHRDRIQDLLIANRQLRAEVATAAQHFQKQKSVFDSKIRMLRTLIDGLDAFGLLRKRLALATLIISWARYYAEVDQNEKQKLHASILHLQRDIRITEAATKTEYIRFRTVLLSHQINSISSCVEDDEFYEALQAILQRYGWILHETQPGNTLLTLSNQDDSGNEGEIQLRPRPRLAEDTHSVQRQADGAQSSLWGRQVDWAQKPGIWPPFVDQFYPDNENAVQTWEVDIMAPPEALFPPTA